MATTINPSDQTITQYNIQTGGASNLLNNVAPSSTSGVPIISQGASAQPVFGTAVVAGGGTGQVTLTNHGVLIGQATSAIASTAAGSAGQVLQSGGASADPVYSTATYPATAGTSGNVLTSDGTNWSSSAAPGGGVLSVSGQLTSAQIKALHATPIQLVAAPGSNKVVQILSVSASYVYGGSNTFTAGAGQTIQILYSTTAIPTSNSTIVSNAILTGSSSNLINVNTAINSTTSSYANLALNLYNQSATEISGNAANNNVVNYTITYMIVAV